MSNRPWPESLLQLWRSLDLDPALWRHRALPWFAEGSVIPCCEDRFGRTQHMQAPAWQAWQQLQQAAERDGIRLEIISAYRSWQAQAAIWRRKLEQGMNPEAILQWSAPPGLSEHHSGRAVDLAAGEAEVLQASFGQSPACQWLRQHAGRFGFVESYPEHNAAGFQPEPWHWCWQE